MAHHAADRFFERSKNAYPHWRQPFVVRDRERSDRFSKLAQASRVGLRDPVAWRHEALLSQPRLRSCRGSDAIPLAREVVVVGVDEALKQLEPPRRLGSPARLDLLADASLIVLVHDWLGVQTSIRLTLVR